MTVKNDPTFRPKMPPEFLNENVEGKMKDMITLMKRCYDHDPKNRPIFLEIMDKLGSALDSKKMGPALK